MGGLLELQDFLDEDLGEFERQKSQATCNHLASHELFRDRREKQIQPHLASSPPVKLYVSRIPDSLSQQGLRNIFCQFGELRDVSRPSQGSGGWSGSRYAFVSFSSRREALAAIEAVSERPPLFLEVQFSRDENEAHRKRLMDEEMDKFSQHIPFPHPEQWDKDIEGEEEDWEKEILEREKMNEFVDKFVEGDKDSDSDSEIPVGKVGASNNPVGATQRIHGSRDSSGIEIFLEKDLPEADVMRNSHGTILGKTQISGRWAVLRLSGSELRSQIQVLESSMKREATEFLKSPPKVKQLCVFERKGKFARVIIDSVGDSGLLMFHGMDDGTRVKVSGWKDLRYFPSSLLKFPPHCVTVRLNTPPPPQTEDVKVIYLTDKKGYPLVELIGVSSDILSQTSESDKTISDPCQTLDKKGLSHDSKAEALVTTESGGISNNSKATPLNIGETMKLWVTNVVSPREVYFAKGDKEFYKLSVEINKQAELLLSPPSSTPEVGSLVLAKASDDIWYRAEILSYDGPRFKFHAVDFGFTEEVDRKRIREIPESLESLKTTNYFAVRCVLEDWINGTPPPTLNEVKEIKKKLPVGKRHVKVRVIEEVDNCYIVDVKGISRSVDE